MTKQLKKSSVKTMKQPYQCKYCLTRFHKESSLIHHQCVKKRRHMEADATGPRIGFAVFSRYNALLYRTTKPKTLDEFVNNQFYIEFVKFGHYIANLRPLHVDKFIDYVIMSGEKIKEWYSDRVYYRYIVDLLKKEPAISAVERSIETIMGWAQDNSCEFTEFFHVVSANEAAFMIQSGKLSPWVLYLANSGGELMEKFNEDHVKMIGHSIDAAYWAQKFRKDTADVEYIQALLDQSGL